MCVACVRVWGWGMIFKLYTFQIIFKPKKDLLSSHPRVVEV